MRILITAGPTREYIDDVRYLSNASSGRMGYEIAKAIVAAGHDAFLISGPVDLPDPNGCEVHRVETTGEMRDVCVELFERCDGVIAAAAVCDYKPLHRLSGKLAKTGEPISIDMIETDDVLAQLGSIKQHRWVVGFALEAENARENALQKLRAKNCDAVVLNGPAAIGSETNKVELIDETGNVVESWSGNKSAIAANLIAWISTHLSS